MSGLDVARADGERGVLLAWWDASTPMGRGLRAHIAHLAREDRLARLKRYNAADLRSLVELLERYDDRLELRREDHERRFAEGLCAAWAVAHVAGQDNPVRLFSLQPACSSLPEADVIDLAIGFAVLWEQLTDPTPRRSR